MTAARTETGLAATAPATRQRWVDVARGIGIVLVVWGHVARANLDLAASPLAAAQDRWLYAFHMPLFFLLAGLFLYPAIDRGRGAFVRGRWWAVAWPYLLWSLVTGLVEVAAAPYVNTPIGLADVAMIPVQPIEQYWFLYALLVCQLAAVLVWPSVPLLGLVAAAGLVLLSIVGGTWIGVRAFAFLPYVAAGVGGAALFAALARAPLATQLLVAAAAWTIFAGLMAAFPGLGDNVFGRLLPAFAGALGTLALATLVARREHPLSSLLVALGQASLAIFVLHTLFSAGTRIALGMAGLAPASPVSVALCLLAGLACPYVAFRLAVAAGLTRQLGFGGAASPPPRLAPAPA